MEDFVHFVPENNTDHDHPTKNSIEEVLSNSVIANNNLIVVSEASLLSTATSAVIVTESSPLKNRKTNVIQVSNNKRPFIFYLKLAKRYIRQYNAVELNALGMAIPTVITISEILKRNGLAIQKKIRTSTVESKDTEKGHLIQKAKIEIVMEKADELDMINVGAASTEAVD